MLEIFNRTINVSYTCSAVHLMLHLQAKNCTTSRKQCKTILLILIFFYLSWLFSSFLVILKQSFHLYFALLKQKASIIHLLDFTKSMFLFIHLKKPVPQSIWHPVCWTFSSLTAAAVPHPSNVMAIHSTTFIRENGKDILCRGGIIKAFNLADNTNLDTLPVDFFMSNLIITGSNSSCRSWGR